MSLKNIFLITTILNNLPRYLNFKVLYARSILKTQQMLLQNMQVLFKNTLQVFRIFKYVQCTLRHHNSP